MDALFIGHAYIDVTFLTDHLPSGDEKYVAQDYAVSFGGNAVTAAFCCAKLGVPPDLIAPLAGDWLGRMFIDMAAKYSISVHGRKVSESSLSFIMPKEGKRAIVRCRDDDYIHPFPQLNLSGCRALHIDGHQADAALHYARACREAGILTSLDGGAVRGNTDELVRFIDVAVVSEDFSRQLGLEPHGALDFLAQRGCRVSGVTMGERGLLWREGNGEIRLMPALSVPPDKVIDTNGAGDIFHGAYVHSYLTAPQRSWAEHFDIARAAGAHSVQHLGNEQSLPTLADIEEARVAFPPKAA
jgi:sugar/nucleoside kinase (ribokinase family)